MDQVERFFRQRAFTKIMGIETEIISEIKKFEAQAEEELLSGKYFARNNLHEWHDEEAEEKYACDLAIECIFLKYSQNPSVIDTIKKLDISNTGFIVDVDSLFEQFYKLTLDSQFYLIDPIELFSHCEAFVNCQIIHYVLSEILGECPKTEKGDMKYKNRAFFVLEKIKKYVGSNSAKNILKNYADNLIECHLDSFPELNRKKASTIVSAYCNNHMDGLFLRRFLSCFQKTEEISNYQKLKKIFPLYQLLSMSYKLNNTVINTESGTTDAEYIDMLHPKIFNAWNGYYNVA